jgi:hypothetical protein
MLSLTDHHPKNSAPEIRSQSNESAAGGRRHPGSIRNPRYVLITNPSVNGGNRVIKRKKADYLVSEGRAEYVAADQIRIITTHEKEARRLEDEGQHYNDLGCQFTWPFMWEDYRGKRSDGFVVRQASWAPRKSSEPMKNGAQ